MEGIILDKKNTKSDSNIDINNFHLKECFDL